MMNIKKSLKKLSRDFCRYKFAWDTYSLSVVNTFSDIHCLMEKDVVIKSISDISYCVTQWFKVVPGLKFKEF